MIRKDILNSIRELSDARIARDFAEIAGTYHPSDIAEALSPLPHTTVLRLLRRLDAHDFAQIFSYFSESRRKAIMGSMNAEELVSLFEHLPSDERVDLYAGIDAKTRDSLLPALQDDTRDEIMTLSSYPEGSTGAATTSEYIAVMPGMTVREAFSYVRSCAGEQETIYVIYVVDREGRLEGTLSLRDLLLARDDEKISDIARSRPVYAEADWPSSRASDMIRRYDLLALPVVDKEGKMLGIFTVDDAMDLEKARDASQLARFGGTAADTDLDILRSPLQEIFKVRALWLIVLTVFGMVTSTFVATQEELLSEAIVLAAFIAPIVDMGGNTGSQTATLVIRAMVMEDVTTCWSDVWKVFKRELPVACALGLTIALLECGMAYFGKGISVSVLLTVGLSMFVCTAVGGVFGLLLPFLARKLGTDPATLASPLITSVMDLLGVFIYFGFAWLFLADLLPKG
ncbi:MAG: magnesium transporter [Mailhella sp.]|nr:magnesium transporter [Mailhella sp.]